MRGPGSDLSYVKNGIGLEWVCDFVLLKPSFLVAPQFISLTRPLDSHLEHVDFSALLHCLHFEQIIQIFASAVLERKIIFLAEGLR